MVSQFSPGGNLMVRPVLRSASARALSLLGVVSMLVGSVTLLGWVFGIPVLAGDFPNLFTIKANAALGIFLAGASAWLFQKPGNGWRLMAARFLASVVLALGVVTLFEYVAGWDLGIDQLLFRDPATGFVGPFHYRGRMTPDTALAFTLIGLALLLPRRSRRAVGILGMAIVVIGVNRVIAMAAASDSLRNYVGIAIPSTAIFLLFGGVFLLRGFRLRLALEKEVAAALGAAVAVLVVIGMLNYRNTSEAITAAFWTKRSQQALTLLQAVRSSVDEVVSITRGYALTGRDEFLRSYAAAIHEIGARQKKLGELMSDNPSQQTRLNELDSAIAARLAFDRDTIAARQTGGLPKVIQHVNSGEGEALTHQIRSVLQQMDGEEHRLGAIQEKNAGEINLETFLILPLGTLFSVVVLGLGFFRLNRQAIALRDSEEHFRLLVEGVQEYAIYAIDPQGRIVSWNAGAQRIKGYRAEEIIGENFSRFYLPEDIANGVPEQELRRAVDNGRFEAEELRVRKDGTPFWAHVSITALFDGNGGLRGFSKITRDITRRKIAEETLRSSHNIAISELLESITDAFVSFDHDWHYVRVNSAAAKLLHKPKEELLGKVLWDVFPEAGQIRFGVEYRRAMAEKVAVNFEHFYPEPLNVWFEVRCHPSACGLNVFFTDVTERKAVEQRLRQLSRAVEQSPSSVIITDTQGNIEYVNPKFTEISGYGFDEALGQNPRILKSGEHSPEFYRELWTTIKAGREWRGEFHNKKKNGELYWVAASICAITDETGAISRFLAVKEDITERKSAQAALMEAKQAAEQANKAKDLFLATLSHELRTPLTPVLLTASSLENDPSVDPELRSQFSLIRSNIELEARLIEDLLDLTKIVHGKFSVRRQILNASDLLTATVETVRSEFLGKHITLQLDAAAHSSTVHADPARLQQVLWNLLKNAIKFTPVGGAIAVRAFNPDPHHLAVEVRDTGIGISPESLQEVFDPFQQAGISGKPQFGGLGLGLAISKAVVEIHGGTIIAASDGPNTGATFTVQLPLYEGAGEIAAEPVNPDKMPVEPRRILLVEDNEPTREVLARLLRKDGHCVEAVGSCAEALEAANSQPASQPFEVLVCDLGLPDGSGVDVVRELKAQTPDLASVALSGFGTEDDIRRSKEAGFTEHLVKPASIQDLRRALAA